MKAVETPLAYVCLSEPQGSVVHYFGTCNKLFHFKLR